MTFTHGSGVSVRQVTAPNTVTTPLGVWERNNGLAEYAAAEKVSEHTTIN